MSDKAAPQFNIGDKALVCLGLASIRPFGSKAWLVAYADACLRFSEKAINVKFEELVARGYIECGVTARSGWLTEKGIQALAARQGSAAAKESR